jgi:hypothetical protein
MVAAVAVTAAGAVVASTVAAEPARMDPAVLSARMAGMILERFMVMISPSVCRGQRPAVALHRIVRHKRTFVA